MQKIFGNLIQNAIRYNKQAEKKIEVSCQKRDDSYYQFWIKDNGIGIKEEKIKDIYKRYYRATSEQGGFGIGLNIVSLIAKEYKLKIDVSSELKVGTRIEVSW